MFEFILLFIFFYWLINKLGKDRKKRRFRKPSLDQELKDLFHEVDNTRLAAFKPPK